MVKENKTKLQGVGHAQSERSMEIAKRALLTATLKEQRLKRDAEIAALGLPLKPLKRSPKPKSA